MVISTRKPPFCWVHLDHGDSHMCLRSKPEPEEPLAPVDLSCIADPWGEVWWMGDSFFWGNIGV